MAVLFGLCASWAGADVAHRLPLPFDPAARLALPPGFHVQVFARLAPGGEAPFRGPRFMAFGPDGHLYLSLGLDNRVVMLPDRDRDGVADDVVTVSDTLDAPQGLAFVDGQLLVANQGGVVRLVRRGETWPAVATVPFIPRLPAGGHTMKSLKQGPDGYLYIPVGSSCNVCLEADPLRATLLRYSKEGRPAGALVTMGRHAPTPVWARGLRNTQGLAWHPRSGKLYGTNNGADFRAPYPGARASDEIPPEHLNHIEAGAHYGWPHCWGERVTDPNFPGPEGFCAAATPPALLLAAHATPIGITFLDRAGVPQAYRGDALVALHGSWNRAVPSGYKVVRVHFSGDVPVSASDFMTGWLEGTGAWGRPVDVAVGPDGAIYVSDDRAGLVYRIHYREEAS